MMLVSTAYLPSIQYIALCEQSQEIYIEAHEHYLKQSYRNRTRIVSSQGILDLTIPVDRPNGSKTKIKDVKISYAEAWNRKHWHALVSAYNSSPFFEFYQDYFSKLYEEQNDFLWDFNMKLLNVIFDVTGIKTVIKETDSFKELNQNNIEDYRYTLSPKKEENQNPFPLYNQVFDESLGFIQNVSIIDAICNIGPETKKYCKDLQLTL